MVVHSVVHELGTLAIVVGILLGIVDAEPRGLDNMDLELELDIELDHLEPIGVDDVDRKLADLEFVNLEDVLIELPEMLCEPVVCNALSLP